MTWTDIPTASLEPGAPIRGVDSIALRDNSAFLKSLVEGTETQKIPNAALVPPTGAGTYLIARIKDGSINNITPVDMWPGGVDTTKLGVRDYLQNQVNAVCLVAGTIRVYATGTRVSDGDIRGRIYKNGVLVGEAGLPATINVDVAVAVGDIISWSVYSVSTARYGYLANMRIYSGNPNFAVA
jgi:hypothetical protein